MSQIGTQISFVTTPLNTTPPYDTANAFMVGLADWGPVNASVTIQSLADSISVVGPRSSTNAKIYDSLDVYLRESGPQPTAFFSRVTGPAASAASLTLTDSSGSAALQVSAVYVGNYGNNVQVAVSNTGGAYVITLTDTYGSALATSPSFTSRGAASAWTNSYVKLAVISGSTLPQTTSATSLVGGTDDRAHVGLAQWTAAIAAFPQSLGPGQLSAPGTTDTAVPGIWSAIGAACMPAGRVGICDMDDGAAAATLVSNIGTAYNTLSGGSLGFWAGNLSAPGVTPNTTRSIPPSAVISALCNRVDRAGNPNLAAAGGGWPLTYCTGAFTPVSSTLETYNAADRSTLNNAGINTFANRFGDYENYGFVASILPSTDVTYWQFNHHRLRMAIGAAANVVGEEFVFSQIDGGGNDVLLFNHKLTDMLSGFLASNALFGTQPGTPNAAFAVDTGPSVNSAQSMQAGNLNANLYVRMSPFAELVSIVVNTVPIVSNVPVQSTTAASGF